MKTPEEYMSGWFSNGKVTIRDLVVRVQQETALEIKKRCKEEIHKLINQDSNETVSDVRRLEGIIEGYEAAIEAIDRMEIE